MLLENKSSMTYGAGAVVGSAVARAFASEGAEVFLAGRTPVKLDGVAEKPRGGGRIGRGRGGHAPSARPRQMRRKLP